MSEVTLKVPVEQVETFRANVYGELASQGDTLDKRAGTLAFPDGESWSKFVADDDPQNAEDNIERHAVDVLKATRNIAALVEVMEQLGWTDPIEGDLEVTAEAKVLGSLIRGALTDAGCTVQEITESEPFEREAFDAATARGAWLADRCAEIEAVAV